MGLFGSQLIITDGFSRTLNAFIGQTNTANNNINNVIISLGNLRSASTGLGQNTNIVINNINSNLRNSQNNIRNGSNNLLRDLNSNVNSFSSSMLRTIAKLTAGWLSFKGAINAVKETLKSGMEFQNASTFLQATYGETEGKQKFKWATQEANETPFSETEVASGLARAHSLGLKDDAKSFRMYEDMGSYAKIQGVGDLNSAVDAIVDAQAGNWMRLQTITGIKRQGLEDFANEKGLGKFSNKKGQVTDQEKLMEVLQEYMNDKGIAGMT